MSLVKDDDVPVRFWFPAPGKGAVGSLGAAAGWFAGFGAAFLGSAGSPVGLRVWLFEDLVEPLVVDDEWSGVGECWGV